jgi:hypothetical protein
MNTRIIRVCRPERIGSIWSPISPRRIVDNAIGCSIDLKMTSGKVNGRDKALDCLGRPLRNVDQSSNEFAVHSITNNLGIISKN